MIRLIADSSCDLKQAEIIDDFVTILPMTINIDNEEYYDGITISNEEFYQKLPLAKILPHTSQVNSVAFLENFKQAVDNGEDILILTISSELSGTVNSARIAKEELGKGNIEIVDSRLVTFAYQALVREAIKLIKQGLSLQELKSKLEELREKVILIAVIGDLTYLIKGGRVSKTQGFIANALSIKPLLTITNGKLDICKKVIGLPKAFNTVADMFNKNYEVDYTLPQYLGHSADLQKLKDLEKVLLSKTQIKPECVCELGPTVGTHAGPGCVGIVFFKK